MENYFINEFGYLFTTGHNTEGLVVSYDPESKKLETEYGEKFEVSKSPKSMRFKYIPQYLDKSSGLILSPCNLDK